eukprot:NODE_4400_length_814_cov_18.524183_g4069_i0.p1 GENE.NODE_4400_length_814_cov_18.524183_g4069_i0~~NODE_4400_length_814_cov_18.524183_g4069_i0.p1  ORF type:complete len:145 (-),score=2.22 NODE_4400_length_814_cov_18.524183_g4069_i0:128-562(-)
MAIVIDTGGRNRVRLALHLPTWHSLALSSYMGDCVVERLWRDSKLPEIGGGTLESHHKNMVNDLVAQHRLTICFAPSFTGFPPALQSYSLTLRFFQRCQPTPLTGRKVLRRHRPPTIPIGYRFRFGWLRGLHVPPSSLHVEPGG